MYALSNVNLPRPSITISPWNADNPVLFLILRNNSAVSAPFFTVTSSNVNWIASFGATISVTEAEFSTVIVPAVPLPSITFASVVDASIEPTVTL